MERLKKGSGSITVSPAPALTPASDLSPEPKSEAASKPPDEASPKRDPPKGVPPN